MIRHRQAPIDDPWVARLFVRPGLEPPSGRGCDLFILGDGASLPDDVAAYGPHHRGQVMAINMSGLLVSRPIDHWVTNHPELFFAGRHLRRVLWNDDGFVCHSAKFDVNADLRWEFHVGYEAHNSALTAVAAAVALGYDRIVIGGVPLDGSGHYYDPGPRAYQSFENVRPSFARLADEGRLARVSAVSGWLADFLGKPTQLQEES